MIGSMSPQNKRTQKKMRTALRMGSIRTKRLRKKRRRGEAIWFKLYVTGGGYLP